MKTLLRNLKRRGKQVVIDNLFSFSGGDYQRERFPRQKFELIVSSLDTSRYDNVLDIGCNEGYITKHFTTMGKFAVGVDNGPVYLHQALSTMADDFGHDTPAFGVYSLTEMSVSMLPRFDLVLLLSVHHQIVNKFGDIVAQNILKALIDRVNRYLVIEFAATNSKYGYEEARFLDNDQASVKEYAKRWLDGLDDRFSIRYLGRNREHSRTGAIEPYRYLFCMEKKNT